jgi:hypothetical protein
MSSRPPGSVHDPVDSIDVAQDDVGHQGDAVVIPDPALRQDPSDRGQTSVGEKYQDALLLWLRWNSDYERSTAALYDARQDPREREEILDQLDQLRHQAVDISRELLDS